MKSRHRRDLRRCVGRHVLLLLHLCLIKSYKLVYSLHKVSSCVKRCELWTSSGSSTMPSTPTMLRTCTMIVGIMMQATLSLLHAIKVSFFVAYNKINKVESTRQFPSFNFLKQLRPMYYTVDA